MTPDTSSVDHLDHLRELTRRLEDSECDAWAILNYLPVGVVVVDQGDRVRYCNLAFADLLGCDAKRLEGIDLGAVLAEGTGGGIDRALALPFNGPPFDARAVFAPHPQNAGRRIGVIYRCDNGGRERGGS